MAVADINDEQAAETASEIDGLAVHLDVTRTASVDEAVTAAVNIASDAARVGSSLEAVHAGAKGAVVAFGKTLARETARSGITVNAVCPADRHATARGDAQGEKRRSEGARGDASRGADAAARPAPRRRRGGGVAGLRAGRLHHRPDAVGQRRADDGVVTAPDRRSRPN